MTTLTVDDYLSMVCVCVSLCGGSSRGVSITLVVFILQISIMASMAFNRIITKPVLVNYNYTLGFVLFLFYGERHRWGREREVAVFWCRGNRQIGGAQCARSNQDIKRT